MPIDVCNSVAVVTLDVAANEQSFLDGERLGRRHHLCEILLQTQPRETSHT